MDGICLHIQCLHMGMYNLHFFEEAIKFAATFHDDVKLINEAIRHFTVVLEVIMFVNRR